MKKRISRSFALMLSVLMLLALLPATVLAAEVEIPLTQQSRYIWVNNKAIVSGGKLAQKYNKVTEKMEDTINEFAGVVGYDMASNTLTLNNANLNMVQYQTQYRHRGGEAEGWGMKPNDAPLNVVLAGKNTIQAAFIPWNENDTNPNAYNAFMAAGDVNVFGPGSLSITNEISNVAYVSAASISGKLSIMGGKVDVKNYANSALIAYDGIYVNGVAGAALTAEVTGPTKRNTPAIYYGTDNSLRTSGKNTVIASGESKANIKAYKRLGAYYASMNSQLVYRSDDSYVTIQEMAKGIKAKAAKKTIKVGAEYEVIPVARAKGQVVGVCTFTSNSKKVAAVDKETGEVIGVSAGKATITIKQANGKTAKCTITVQ